MGQPLNAGSGARCLHHGRRRVRKPPQDAVANSCKTYFAGRGASGAAVAPHLPELFERAGIDPKRRGETLSLAEFVNMGKALLALQQD